MTDLAPPAKNAAAIRKAAILISTLDTKTADELLDRMTPEQQAQVRQAVMDLNEIRPSEQDYVIREFIGGGESITVESSDGVELDVSLAEKLRAPELYEAPAVSPSRPPPFQALCEASAAAIARQLERQHPQVVAVVVAHLPPRRAAELVQCLGAKLQSDVLRRVAELDQADPEVIREIEEELEQLLRGEIRAARNRDAGLSNVIAILNAAGNDRTDLLKNLRTHEGEFANLLGAPAVSLTSAEPAALESTNSENHVGPKSKQLRPSSEKASRAMVTLHGPHLKQRSATSPERNRDAVGGVRVQPNRSSVDSHAPVAAVVRAAPAQLQIEFEELVQMNDRSWATLIRAIDPQVFLLALAGASEAFVDRMMAQLPPRDSENLRKRLEQMGPIRLDDIDRAQRHIAQRAAELLKEARIQIPQPKSFAAAA